MYLCKNEWYEQKNLRASVVKSTRYYMKDLQIECPRCGWEPDGGAYWMCSACGHQWNTFDTAARCPRCHVQYERTACIPWAGGCHAYEPHVDWYKNLDDLVQEELDEVLVEQEVEVI